MRDPAAQPYGRPMSPRSTGPSLVVPARAALVAALLAVAAAALLAAGPASTAVTSVRNSTPIAVPGRVVVVAVDPAGNRSQSRPRAFRIVA